MRIGQGLSTLDLYRLFTEHIERQRVVAPVQQQPGQPGQDAQPGRLQFKFLDSFDSSANGAQQWLVRREIAETPGVSSARAPKAQSSERTTRTLFADGFENHRVPPVQLDDRATANRFQRSNNATQDNGFHASVNDF
jgi:hypothetical protein